MNSPKFRFWSPAQNKFITPRCWVSINGDFNVESDGSPDIIIQQWTGLKDNDGKEIYEGDIIKTYQITPLDNLYGGKTKTIEEDFYSTVKYNQNEGLFQMIWKSNDHLTNIRDFKYTRWTDRRKLEFEIIGNIYQNPDLLN